MHILDTDASVLFNNIHEYWYTRSDMYDINEFGLSTKLLLLLYLFVFCIFCIFIFEILEQHVAWLLEILYSLIIVSRNKPFQDKVAYAELVVFAVILFQ